MALQHLPTLPVPAMLGHILTLHRLGWYKLVLYYMNANSITDAYNYTHERQLWMDTLQEKAVPWFILL